MEDIRLSGKKILEIATKVTELIKADTQDWLEASSILKIARTVLAVDLFKA